MATIRQRFNRKGVPLGWQAMVRRVGHAPESRMFPTKPEADAWGTLRDAEVLKLLEGHRVDHRKST